MKRPATLKVLGKGITFHFVPPEHEGLKDSPEDREPGNARNDPDQQAVWVAEGQPLESEQDAVLHEVLHILEAYMGIKTTEGTVTKFATGLLAVIKDNPSFVAYLRGRK